MESIKDFGHHLIIITSFLIILSRFNLLVTFKILSLLVGYLDLPLEEHLMEVLMHLIKVKIIKLKEFRMVCKECFHNKI